MVELERIRNMKLKQEVKWQLGMNHDSREAVLYQLINKDDWSSIQEVECFLFIFDTMPERMRTVVDLRLTGHSILRISKMMKISPKTVYWHLTRAKKRIFNAVI